jgi:DNA-3-methyladenine glycosylase
VKLPLTYYRGENVTKIAKDLIGKRLITCFNKQLTSGVVVETEAYSFIEKGCHAYKGMTPRNAPMFEPGGISYVYLCYGIHHLFNIVTNGKHRADAVLIRALQPLEGEAHMMRRMQTKTTKRITSGPGKLTRALGITLAANAMSLRSTHLWLEDGSWSGDIEANPRIGIDYAGDDALLPWRFIAKDNVWISK